MSSKDDQESYVAWRGAPDEQQFRARLQTTRNNLTATVCQLNAYVAELDDVLAALLEQDRREEEAESGE